MAWVVLLSSALAVGLTGIFATVILLVDWTSTRASVTPAFWLELSVAAGLTIASLCLRSLRWIFLLRRVETRIAIRDAYIGYFAGLSLLLTPFLLGEIAVRAAILRKRGAVPVGTTTLVNLWERLLDITALAAIAGIGAIALARTDAWTWTLLAMPIAAAVPHVRQLALRAAQTVTRPVAFWFDDGAVPLGRRLTTGWSWTVAFGVSVIAWLLPGIAFWRMANLWDPALGLLDAEHAYAVSASLGGLVLAPGGVLVVGTSLLDRLTLAGMPVDLATLSVFGTRVATVGVATALGIIFAVVHARTAPAASATHFDDIADAYDVQIPEGRRESLLEKKTGMMREVLLETGAGQRGLDVGCGQGAYVGRMRELGFDVVGIDVSAGQIALAERKLGGVGAVTRGSVLQIPAKDASYDFVYVINVLHHLSSMDEQRRAFTELVRVLKPGGLLFVHEINTRNLLFRFYMGYVFPSLNCIDEGNERWLRADRLALYTDASAVTVRYFTFLPDFLPQSIVRALAPIERLLERSSANVYSAHYMAVLRKAPVSDARGAHVIPTGAPA
jgi:ubiquinone/menaquinone biosynthesis C-methylase UbiE